MLQHWNRLADAVYGMLDAYSGREAVLPALVHPVHLLRCCCCGFALSGDPCLGHRNLRFVL